MIIENSDRSKNKFAKARYEGKAKSVKLRAEARVSLVRLAVLVIFENKNTKN